MRLALPPLQQQQHADSIARHASTSGLPLCFSRFAAYWPNDGEVDTGPLIARLMEHGKDVALPILATNRLKFYAFDPDVPLVNNKYGIPEPATRGKSPWPLFAIGAVFLPLVAFDARGFRLGMGGGYYDRTFAYDRIIASRMRPLLIGIAHGLQETERLPVADWDVPLDGVLTESGFRSFTPRGARFGAQPARDRGNDRGRGGRPAL
jgi:5-formyltetrahydrofolate cyclo-ligase